MTERPRTADEQHTASRAALDAVVVRRDALYTAILGLERAMASASGDDPAGWAARAETAALALRATWRRHVTDTEAPDGIFATVVADSPRSIPAADRLRAEHPPLGAAVDALVATLAGVRDPAGVEQARADALDLLRDLLAHRHRGSELVHEAYQVDLAAGD